jgi:hypothetical protein
MGKERWHVQPAEGLFGCEEANFRQVKTTHVSALSLSTVWSLMRIFIRFTITQGRRESERLCLEGRRHKAIRCDVHVMNAHDNTKVPEKREFLWKRENCVQGVTDDCLMSLWVDGRQAATVLNAADVGGFKCGHGHAGMSASQARCV